MHVFVLFSGCYVPNSGTGSDKAPPPPPPQGSGSYSQYQQQGGYPSDSYSSGKILMSFMRRPNLNQGCSGLERILVGFTTTYAISAYHY
jgi:hypothetical protein